jgi:hypothetical protein
LGDGLGAGGLNGDGSSGAFGALARGLGGSIPGVPIPFWSLLLLLVALPLSGMWRKSTLAMFDWPGEGVSGLDDFDGTEMVKVGGDAADVAHTRDELNAAGGRRAA